MPTAITVVGMNTRNISPSGPKVSAIGLGCMGMSDFYGSFDDRESLATLQAAVDAGVTFFDTADIYGPFSNEALVGRGLASARDDVVIATKFGVVRTSAGQAVGLNSTPAYVHRSCDLSLQRLGVEAIDLYFQHRVDPNTPIEETVGAMAELVAAGKVRHIGLSEAGADTIRRAHAVHPIAALQVEYSLWSRDIEAETLPTCRELGIGVVAYSPLGRGFLTGTLVSTDSLEASDWRHHAPRFTGENLETNLQLVEKVKAIAAAKGCTLGQISLAWLLAQGDDIVPIPGTKRRKWLAENITAADIQLTTDELAQLDAAMPVGSAAGDRYPDMSSVGR